MRTQTLFMSGALALSLVVPAVHAAEVDVFNMSGHFGQAPYTLSADGWANATVAVAGNGVNRTANLFHTSYSFVTGEYKFWRGDIPVEYVTLRGTSSISVDINTCDVSNVGGCGPVHFTVETDEPAVGWTDNGVRTYKYDGYIQNEVGSRQVRNSTSTGTVNGISVDNTRAFSGKYNEVSISVTVGN